MRQRMRPRRVGVEEGERPRGAPLPRRFVVVIADPGNEHLVVASRETGADVLVARSGAMILGFGDHVLVVKNGRSYGLLAVP